MTTPNRYASLVVAGSLCFACGGRTDLPVPPPAPVVPQAISAPQLAAARDRTCAVLADGTVHCWGADAAGDLSPSCAAPCTDSLNGPESCCLTAVPVAGLSAIVEVALGGQHSCALRGDGTVLCWGSNSNGQLGDGSQNDRATPAPVPGLTGVVRIAAGDTHTCALLADASAVCWGQNFSGQLGDGTTTDSATPVAVQGLSGAIALACSESTSCALVAGGGASGWGDDYNFFGPLGPWWRCTSFDAGGSSICPKATSLSGLPTLQSATAAGYGVGADGSALDWRGSSSSYDAPGTPTTLSEFGSVSEFGAMFTGSLRCGLGVDGAVLCEQVAGLQGWPTSASAVPGLSTVAHLAVGAAHACAMLASGAVWCWGSNATGQLGTGDTTDRTAPVAVMM